VKILLDHCTPAPLRKFLLGHQVAVAEELGWERVSNGTLLTAAENAGFDLLVSADQSIRYQQNLTHRSIALLVLTSPHWPTVKPYAPRIAVVASAMKPGEYRKFVIS